MLKAEFLRCELLVNPLGVDQPAPQLSWRLSSEERGELQTAYRILVASTPELLAKDKGDLWDSGKVEEGETLHIPYAGQALVSNQRCHWKVRAWDHDGDKGAWSEPALWTMGILDGAQWSAQWIGGAANVPHLRKEVALKGAIKHAQAHVSALGIFEFTINGQRVGEDQLMPGWTDFSKRIHYLTYDVTAHLTAGPNTLAGILARGWYCGFIGFEGRDKYYGENPGLLVQIHIDYADGSSEVLGTDTTWKTAEGPIRMGDLLHGEEYDRRRELGAWTTTGYDDAAWAAAVEITPPAGAKFLRHPAPAIRKSQELPAVQVTQPASGTFVFDLGQNMVGGIRLKTRGSAGRRIVIRYAEMLQPSGVAYLENMRRAQAMDLVYLKGTGEDEIWETRFSFHGFRYVEIQGLDTFQALADYGKEEVPLDTVTGLVWHSECAPTGDFECSHPKVNQLVSNIKWGWRGNSLDIPTDCPQRDERLGWTGDAQIFVRTATYLFDTAAFYRKWLVDLEDEQHPDGMVTDIAPTIGGLQGGNAGWGDAAVICPWTCYEAFNDKQILERHYGMMTRWIGYLKANSNDLLRPDAGYGDWLFYQAETPKDVIGTAYFAHVTTLVAKAAEVLGKPEDVQTYNELAQAVRDAFNAAYVDGEGRIKGNTQTCYLLALKFDLLPEARVAQAVQHLVEDIKARDGLTSTGFLGVSHLNPVLTKYGHHDIASAMLHNERFPGWLFEVNQGATTIWERWDGWTPEKGFQANTMNSFNHYSFGAVGAWLMGQLAGIESEGHGFRTIDLSPRPCGSMTYVKAHYDSIRGRIVSNWKREGDKFLCEFEIPAGTEAQVHIPPGATDITVDGKSPAATKSVRRYEQIDGHYAFRIGSGKYNVGMTLAEQA